MNTDLAIVASQPVAIPTFIISPPHLEMRDSAVAEASNIESVGNSDENTRAVRVMQEMKAIAAMFERSRKALKEPFIAAGRQIDRLVASELVDLEKELGRVGTLVSQFALEEQRRVEEELEHQRRELERIEREKQEELRRIEMERQESERKAREAEEAARRAEAEAKTEAQKREAAEKQKLAEAAAQAAAEAQAKAYENAKRVEDTAAALTAVEATPVLAQRAYGQINKTDWEIQITNPFDLARFHPDCVKIEPVLTQIKQYLNDGVKVRGVNATKATKVGVRTGKVIDV